MAGRKQIRPCCTHTVRRADTRVPRPRMAHLRTPPRRSSALPGPRLGIGLPGHWPRGPRDPRDMAKLFPPAKTYISRILTKQRKSVGKRLDYALTCIVLGGHVQDTREVSSAAWMEWSSVARSLAQPELRGFRKPHLARQSRGSLQPANSYAREDQTRMCCKIASKFWRGCSNAANAAALGQTNSERWTRPGHRGETENHP